MTRCRNGSDDGTSDGAGGDDAVARFVRFQQTGRGFDGVWADIGPIVADFARRNLQTLGVRRGVARNAVDDVVNSTATRLLRLAEPQAGGQFDPARLSKPGLSGLRGWLWRVVERQAADWKRKEYGGRGMKIVPESGLEWNELSETDDGASILKRQVAKLQRADLLPVLHQCINQLADPDLRKVVRLRLDEALSQRDIAERVGTSAPTIHRRLQDAYELLRPLLEDRGIDAAWLAA
jgi:RNA polymerase sigma factor (sigma-70 family)